MSYKSFISIFLVLSFFYLNMLQLEALQTAAPTYNEISSIPKEEITSLDLTYVYDSDYRLGKLFDEEEIIEKILSSPNLKELNLSGQALSPSLLSILHENLPHLKKLIIKGSVCLNEGDGLFYSEEFINKQTISEEMLQALFFSESPIEVLDLSLSTIDDHGLEKISRNAHNLREIYLEGASEITDSGIMALVDNLPNLKLIDLSSYTLRKPMANLETLAPQISKKLIKTISDRGIIIIQNKRTPWF